LGQSVEHLVCSPKIKGFNNPFEIKPNPLQKQQTNTKSIGHNPRVDLCPLKQKVKKIGDFLENGFRVGWGQNGKFGIWVASGGWVVEKGRWWCLGGGGGDGWRWVGGILDFREERDGGGVSGCLYGCWENGGGGEM
jgi:hypothetical protein